MDVETIAETGEPNGVVQDARERGWVPKEEFRGDPAKWVDAAQFLTINGNLRNDRDRVRADLDGVKQQNAALQAQLKAQQAALDALQSEVVEVRTEDLQAAETDLTSQIKTARQAGDFDLEESLRDKREELRRKKLTVDKPLALSQAIAQQKVTETPEFKQFLRDNPWFETDRVMAAASVALLGELNASGVTKDMSPGQRYALAAQKTKERFGLQESRGAAKMEGSRGGAGGEASDGRAYADLPADAKAACDRQATRVVGPGKKFKDMAAWQKSYTKAYFS